METEVTIPETIERKRSKNYETKRRYYLKHKDSIIAKNKEWAENHPERVRELSRASSYRYYIKNKEKLKEQRKQKIKNKLHSESD